MIIDTDRIKEAIAGHYEAYGVTDDELRDNPLALVTQRRQQDERVAAVDAMTRAEQLNRRYAARDPYFYGQLLTRLYAFVCARTGNGNETDVDLDHEANTAEELRVEFEATFHNHAYKGPVLIKNLEGQPKPEPDIECPQCGIYHYGNHPTLTLCPTCLAGGLPL